MRGAAAGGGCRTSPRCPAGAASWVPVRCGCCPGTWRGRPGRTGRRGCSAAGCGWSPWTGRSRTCRTATRTPRSSDGPPASPGTGRSRRPGGSRRRSPGPAACRAPRSAGTPAPEPLAADLPGCSGPGMLVLADRKFLSWAAARAFLATGAHLLWRASASFTLKPVQVLADGTYLAELKPPRKKDGPPVTVRVIEYTVHTTAETAASRPRRCSAWSPTCSTWRSTRRWTWPARTPCAGGARQSPATTRPTWARASPSCAPATPRASCRRCGRCSPSTRPSAGVTGIAADAAGIPPDQISFPHALAAATATVAAFPP